MATIDLFHYARAKDLDAISDEGLKPGARTVIVESALRASSVYAWLAPDFDVMGYSENPQYVCLRVRVETTRCRVAPMELIVAAYVNQIGRGQPKNPDVAAKLIAAYEKVAAPLYEYLPGMFRAPEVLIEGEISADDIAVVKAPEAGMRGEENRRQYASRWGEHLIRVLGAQRTLMQLRESTEAIVNRGLAVRVAKHDDATAYLETYMLVETGEFFTVEKED
ncbi:MAG: hypothetical protein L0Y55_11035 [Anaerolineales bacterium]|nr:hypothetical protein [Anaerolineales bacterium]